MSAGRKKILLCQSMAICMLALMACSDDNNRVPDTPEPPPSETSIPVIISSDPDPAERSFQMNSTVGCAIDSDCNTGLFCFHGLCTSECSEDAHCTGGTCGSDGRCVKASGESSDPQTPVVERIPGVEILTTPVEKVFVDIGATSVKVELKTTQDNGPIQYTVRNPAQDTVSKLMTATAKVDENTRVATYELTIPVFKSSMGDDGEPETVILDTSVSSYEIRLVPSKPASGLYSGSVMANEFAGVALPVRFMVETTPEIITKFEDIEAMTLYLPSSGADLFAPESVPDATKTVWSKVQMKKETSNCMNADSCWAAEYSTNNFVFDKSELIDESHAINRSIRFEFVGYDRQSMMFDGNMRDIMEGFYREIDENGSMKWATPTLEGSFVATRTGKLDLSPEVTVVSHKKVTENTRLLTDGGPEICDEATIAQLMDLVVCPEDNPQCDMSVCSTLTTSESLWVSDHATTCLLAVSNKLLEDEGLVSKIIEGLITQDVNDPQPVHEFKSLQDFMGDCARTDGICKHRPEIVCAVDLLGRSYLTSGAKEKNDILANWHQLMRESYLGRQFSAWQNDVDVRRRWLENSTSPSFLSAVLEKINSDMLTGWENEVFGAHRGVLARQFNQRSLEVLTRVDKDSSITSKRDLILAEFAEAWEGVSDSLSLALRRYDALFQATEKRTQKAAEMQPYLFDLYYAGLVESYINKTTGNGSLNAAYGKNLYENVARIRSLNQSFDDLVFMRDAEVATSTSVDPMTSNLQVLSSRKNSAKETVAAARERRDRVFDAFDRKTAAKAEIEARLSNTLEQLQTELVAICGLPYGCLSPKETGCAPNPDYGKCGFDIPADSASIGDITKMFDETTINMTERSQYYAAQKYVLNPEDLTLDNLYDYYSLTNNGEAAEAILAYRAAVKDVDIAKADFIALSNKVDIARATCDGYAQNIEKWDQKRKDLFRDIQANIDVINAHYDNITQAQRDKLEAETVKLQHLYQTQSDAVKQWETLTSKHVDVQTGLTIAIGGLNAMALVSEFAASSTDRLTEAAASIWDESSDVTVMGNNTTVKVTSTGGMAKNAILTAGAVIAIAADAAAMGAKAAVAGLEAEKAIRDMEHSFAVELQDKQTGLQLAEIELAYQQAMSIYQAFPDQDSCLAAGIANCLAEKTCECDERPDTLNIATEANCEAMGCRLEEKWFAMGLEQWILSEQNAIDTLDQVNDTMRELFAIQDQYDRDVQDLEFKRAEYLKLSQDLLVKREQVLKAQIAQYAALKHFYSVQQRAAMIQSQYDAQRIRLDKIINLYSTPATIFSFASELEVVESKIELAKERIYDYLAAVEYLSVRPFVDLRRATYLARSTDDLDTIVDQIDTVVSKCGGGTPNTASVEVSVREMMGITSDFVNMTMAERFRQVIAKGNIPINALTRYTVDSNVRDLLKKGSDLRSGTFAVTIDKSMNLATTCNAKIDSIAIQIVGENLIRDGQGTSVIPTITLFYDGQTQLASCQPNIQALVDTLGPKTSYGKYSTFIVEPTKISPTAKINEYGEANITLAGKPFATSYTVLIDTQISENAKINWDNVEDIKLKINYTYQDLFPNGSPCVAM